MRSYLIFSSWWSTKDKGLPLMSIEWLLPAAQEALIANMSNRLSLQHKKRMIWNGKAYCYVFAAYDQSSYAYQMVEEAGFRARIMRHVSDPHTLELARRFPHLSTYAQVMPLTHDRDLGAHRAALLDQQMRLDEGQAWTMPSLAMDGLTNQALPNVRQWVALPLEDVDTLILSWQAALQQRVHETQYPVQTLMLSCRLLASLWPRDKQSQEGFATLLSYFPRRWNPSAKRSDFFPEHHLNAQLFGWPLHLQYQLMQQFFHDLVDRHLLRYSHLLHLPRRDHSIRGQGFESANVLLQYVADQCLAHNSQAGAHELVLALTRVLRSDSQGFLLLPRLLRLLIPEVATELLHALMSRRVKRSSLADRRLLHDLSHGYIEPIPLAELTKWYLKYAKAGNRRVVDVDGLQGSVCQFYKALSLENAEALPTAPSPVYPDIGAQVTSLQANELGEHERKKPSDWYVLERINRWLLGYE